MRNNLKLVQVISVIMLSSLVGLVTPAVAQAADPDLFDGMGDDPDFGTLDRNREGGSRRTPDSACNGLIPSGARMVCSGFEPNWAVVFVCRRSTLSADFVDPVELKSAPGTVRFLSQNPWEFNTSHGVVGSIASTPAACIDDDGSVLDFTATPQVVPGLSGRPQSYVCCRIQ